MDAAVKRPSPDARGAILSVPSIHGPAWDARCSYGQPVDRSLAQDDIEVGLNADPCPGRWQLAPGTWPYVARGVVPLAPSGSSVYPFTEPAVSPDTTKRWATK